jgi:hypothetical protein
MISYAPANSVFLYISYYSHLSITVYCGKAVENLSITGENGLIYPKIVIAQPLETPQRQKIDA